MSAECLEAAAVAAFVTVLRGRTVAFADHAYLSFPDPEFLSWSLWWSLWDEVAAAIRCVRPLVLLVEAEAAVREGFA